MDQSGADVDVDAVMQLPGAQRCPLLARLPVRELDLVLSASRVNLYEPRDRLSTLHTFDDAVHVVLRGVFFERVRHQEGQGAFAHPVDAGRTIGLTDVLVSAELDRTVRALAPSVALRISGVTVRALAGASGAMAAAIAETGLRQLRRAEADRVVLAASDATGRVLRRVNEPVSAWGRDTDDGVDITLPLTQEQLGAWAGASRETTAKTLRWLREEGLIETSRRHLLAVDAGAIAALAFERGVTPAGTTQQPFQWRAMRWRCQRSSVSGVISQPARRARGSAAAIAPRRLRSGSVRVGRSIWRRRTVS